MVDVLSQNEIDALLAALSSGEMDAEELKKEETQKKIRSYDFKRALRFSKDHIRSLTRIHENFARYLTTYFSAQLRTFVQINVVQVEQLPYDEFIRSIPKMTVLNIFEAEPLVGRMVLEVHPNIAYAMLDRLLGGTGIAPSSISSMTEIETIIMERIFSRAFDSLQEAWKTVLDISPRLEALETNPQFMQIVSPNETIALISLSTKIGDTTGMINLCIPHVVLEPIMSKLSAHQWFISEKKASVPEEVDALKQRVSKAQLSIVAELGVSQLTVSEFLGLSVGDVISLNKPMHDGLSIKVGDKLKYIGSPGTIKDRVAVQIDEIVIEGAEEFDE
ncbi:flagellar motor switch protein FliM [Paenibacillus glucanolyticus]|jgi:flagellar motor switch protein FliM|uniref:Flagellar motor switch protein FliM n=2 Tax=Paenibacillus glucanolyticus TaxID=59843 RepID=A0A163ECL3_9BACL|nr:MULTISPECIES: flagellar motor switch protein FliM [Paenibacillus]ANA83163.1 flagellar motor switch protein FliM [Paenibacillus glucanolyticus]AVV57747.1 flagellar motor switch protein FliM [Paenibacillus glucanolyticus]AWP26908.1 flagellar motor switch protein FliM [Paenibacillus sp. Cedars]ETT34522.1 flagellar motor switch protein FliM [Paenibacillus sp. FSL R5-808]KZS43739.1 flagellar motor switch protein FliM [Paenibacillus glucanolyticus]